MVWINGEKIVASRLEDKADRNAASGYPSLGGDALIPFNRLPTGMIALYAGLTAPTGWVLCDGSAINRTIYSALFAIISTVYGPGDGSTTFNVPFFQGRVVIGTGSGTGLTVRTRGQIGGEETHVLTEAEIPAHVHTGGATYAGSNTITSGASQHGATTNTGTTGSDTAHENMPPYGVLTYIIKT